ncbi:MAG: IS66 family transposase, partial [Geminicoccaceae bacterium]
MRYRPLVPRNNSPERHSYNFQVHRGDLEREFPIRRGAVETDGRSPIAEEALRQIAELYAIEKTVRGAAPEARLAARRKLSAPIIE